MAVRGTDSGGSVLCVRFFATRSEGGVEVGDVDAKAKKLLIPVDGSVSWELDLLDRPVEVIKLTCPRNPC